MSLQRLLGFVVLTALTGCQSLTTTPTPVVSPSQAIPPTPEAPVSAGSRLLHNADGSLDALKGIARFVGASSCTGTFIKTSEQAGAPAYLITNGHCAQQWHANDVYRDVPAGDGYKATFNYFIDTTDAQIAVPASTIAYSTMKGRDVAIVELAAMIGELTGQGIQPFAIADTAPTPTAAISVLGVPVTGIQPEEWYLRREDCSMTGQADLLEFQWHFFDAFRNTCRDIFGGSSGSPVFAEGSDAVFALINTTTVGGEYACALGVPCEVTGTGTQMRPNTSYATPIVGLSRCFNADGRFGLGAPDCPLDDGQQLKLSGHPLSAIQPVVTDNTGATRRAAWNTTLSGDFTHYRYKTGPVSSVDCRDEAGYSDPIALVKDNLIEEEIPEAEGFYYLCLVAGDRPAVDVTWQPIVDATVGFAHIDTTPPLIPPILSVQEFESEYLVEPIFKLPELVHYILKFGPPATTDCNDPAGYEPYRRFPVSLEKRNQVPAKLCVIGYDDANNPTTPLEQILGGT
ncbi:MAG: trypsin-like serine peptidase [Anaerolineae bacterium]